MNAMNDPDLPITFDDEPSLTAWLAKQHGRALHLVILHDDDCPAASGAPCRCQPSFRVEALTADNYLAGQQAQNQWRGKSGA